MAFHNLLFICWISFFLVRPMSGRFCDVFLGQPFNYFYGLHFKEYYLLIMDSRVWRLDFDGLSRFHFFSDHAEGSTHRLAIFNNTRYALTAWLQITNNERFPMTGLQSIGDRFSWKKLTERITNGYFNVEEDRDVPTIVTPLSDDLNYLQRHPPKKAFGFKQREDDSINCFFGNLEMSPGNLSTLKMTLRCASFATKIVQHKLVEVSTVNRTGEVISLLMRTMDRKGISYGSDLSVATQFQDTNQLIAIFGVVVDDSDKSSSTTRTNRRLEDFTKFVLIFDNKTSITYCFSDDILFNRGCPDQKFQVLIDCSPPTVPTTQPTNAISTDSSQQTPSLTDTISTTETAANSSPETAQTVADTKPTPGDDESFDLLFWIIIATIIICVVLIFIIIGGIYLYKKNDDLKNKPESPEGAAPVASPERAAPVASGEDGSPVRSNN